MGADAIAPVGSESPNVTRLYGFFLGGAHGFPADREAAATLEETWPQIRDTVRDNLLFLGEAVRFLAGEVGIRRFLDIGSSMPTMGNVHELAQQLAPDARVVYVDNDPVVLAQPPRLSPACSRWSGSVPGPYPRCTRLGRDIPPPRCQILVDDAIPNQPR
ncbi:SAM-dependent methyltransferase [Frankia sp. Cpl3]|uniref:SAM-dependent methyltransferase n=1 Tax=Parafrankia colletiae TaxID=573497 RepID=UPI0009FBAB61|nr:SAM-dependent methyltransferase [Parafrankia colletiae]MCK9904550.1 SAM-dependent methyltransferase [Frankia sp. Cpl3]